MRMDRRRFLRTCSWAAACGSGLSAAGASMRRAQAADDAEGARMGLRRVHLSISIDALEADEELLGIVSAAGVTDVWLAGFLYGHWSYPVESLVAWRGRVEAAGMAAHVITVPLGHPGDSLGAMHGDVPLTPPSHWRMAVGPDGAQYSGTSLHAPATEENVAAVRAIRDAGFREIFLDDDFRLAPSPCVVGGCFCDEHKARFLEARGYGEPAWEDLLDAVQQRDPRPVLREWVAFTCDELTGCFRAQQAAVPDVALGIMVMYLGSEKAGIRLDDYREVPFRVGELMFSDMTFDPPKGKTDELFSALFHRRYARPELAYSETTAYPVAQLSPHNLAAKLAVSTITDCRNTMLMSGLTTFPRDRWDPLASAIRTHMALHPAVAGHRLRGPFKHYWGEAERLVGDDNPFSQWLALGVPFEVCDAPPTSGWTFLGDADARDPGLGAKPDAATWFARPGAARGAPGRTEQPETSEALFALKERLLPELGATPHVVDATPVVCAWYPSAEGVLLWNHTPEARRVGLRVGNDLREIPLDALGVAWVDDVRLPAPPEA